MIRHQDILDEKGTNHLLMYLIKSKQITVGGNKSLKIYGTLNCKSGKRMKTQNRVFFKDIQEAVALGFRPCGRCMRLEYLEWKKRISK